MTKPPGPAPITATRIVSVVAFVLSSSYSPIHSLAGLEKNEREEQSSGRTDMSSQPTSALATRHSTGMQGMWTSSLGSKVLSYAIVKILWFFCRTNILGVSLQAPCQQSGQSIRLGVEGSAKEFELLMHQSCNGSILGG